MASSKGKAVSFLSGLGVLVVAVVAVVYWHDLATSYYGWKLRKHPDYFLEVLGEPATVPKGKAVRRFVKSEEGCLVLMRAYAKKKA